MTKGTVPILNRAPAWRPTRSQYQILWHGCTERDRINIEANAIDLSQCAPATDFGRGFYTTTLKRQAEHWAWDRYYQHLKKARKGVNRPVVLRFRVPRYAVNPKIDASTLRDGGLDSLLSLHFVRGDYGNEDYWSLVQYCRRSTHVAVHDHKTPLGGWYDMVAGPISAFWEQRVAMLGADQFSFHTKDGITILQDLINSGDPNSYRWEPV